MMKLKQFLTPLINVSFFIALSTTQLFGQTCTKTANIPPNGSLTVNGINVTSSSTGAVTSYLMDYQVCGTSSILGISEGSLFVGSGASTADSRPWQTTLTFSKPVNKISILISAAGSVHNEKFEFTSNNGTITITDNGSCFSTISGNTILSGQGASSTGTGGGGIFTLTSPTPFTQLVMKGNGGDGGSLLAICETSIVESCTGTIDSDGDGVADECDLDNDNDGILDSVELATCGVPSSNIDTGKGVIINKLFTENFGTMSTTSGTRSVNMAGLGTGAQTTYNYYDAILGTTPTNSADGSNPPNSLQDGRYTIFNNISQTASWASSTWQNIGDHTNGGTSSTAGRMFIVNASTSAGEFYRKTITNIERGIPINISLWAMNLDINNTANNGRILPNITINFIQSGSVVYTFNTGDISRTNAGDVNAWKFFKNPSLFIPTSNQPIDVVLVNNSPGGAGNDLAIDDIVIYQALCDLDNDGIPNHLDLDSDGEGCADAIEGTSNFTNAQLATASGTLTAQPVNQNFGTTVDANGIPTIVGAAGQTLGQSQDATKNDCLDTDGDGVPNWLDLDDDNDGILDMVECQKLNLLTNGNFDANFSPDWTNDGGWTYNTTGKYVENLSSSFNDTYGNLTQLVSNIPPGTIPLTFTLGAKNNGTSNTASLKIILNGVVYATINNTSASTDNITIALTNGATSDFATFTAGTSYVSRTFTIFIPYSGPKSASLAFKKGGNELDHWYIDNVSILTCDNDVDGIPNDLDLDSDGDGCPDAIEGGGNYTASQLTIASGSLTTQTVNQNFGTNVDANGIPIMVGATGQTLGQSQDATKNDCLDSDNDGYPNWMDLDDDNDGILDIDECPNVTIVNNGTFTSPVTEWTLGTGWDTSAGLAKNENDNVMSDLSQTLNNLNLTNGLIKLSFTLGTQDGFNNAGYSASLNIILNGTTYATFTNGTVRTVGTNNVTQTLSGGATSTFTPFSTALISGYTTQNVTITIPYTGPNSATLTFKHNAGYDDWSIDNVSIDLSTCDLDGDGIPNDLDLDSDGDGCSDALEGGASFTTTDLQNSSMAGGNSGAGYIGVPTPITQNLGNTVGNTPTTMGVPIIAGTGQTVNNASNSFVNDCITTSCPPDPYAVQQTWWLSSSGEKVRVDFQTGTPVLNNPTTGFLGQGVIGDGQEGNATVTHPVTGELLFATDGSNVYRASDGAKATGFAGGSTTSAEAAAVIPDPQGILGRDFIIFGNSATSSFGAITRAKYNLETNTIHSKVTYLAGSTTEALEVIPHTNGTDYWVLVTTSDQKTKSFLYSKTSGFNTTPVSSTEVPYAENSATNSFISWDPRIPGKVLIARQNKVGLANFNPSTGILGTWQVYITVNNPIAWTSYATGYGAALSPNGRYIYYQQYDQPSNSMYLKYYDLINKTTTTLDSTIGNIAATKIAPDGKLYRIGYVGPTGSAIRQLFYINADANTPPATAGSQVQFDTGGRQVSIQLPNNVYWGCITCQSGTVAPTLTNAAITTVPATVGDLINLLTASNKPAGTAFTIHTDATATDANKLANSTAIVAGTTYYIAFYDGLAICYSPTISIKIGETFCYKPAVIDANTYPSQHGITALGRAGEENDNWPMIRQSAWTVLESKTKGFVVNRVKFNASNHPVADDGTTLVITTPVEGMMVYDTTNNCLKVYTSNDGGSTFAWHCMNVQTCPQ